MKKKLFCLALAAALLLSGCAMSAPASVGRIGDVEIPAGEYLLAQYNAYTTVSGLADLATGESANDVDTVLKAQATGTIGDEEVTLTGKEYLARLTQRELEHFAAVETEFAALDGTLDEAAQESVRDTADAMWEDNSELYEKNGIGKQTLVNNLENNEKQQALLQLLYGADGPEAVSEDEYKTFITEDCRYIEGFEMPLFSYSTFTMADEDQSAAIHDLGDKALQELTETVPAGTDAQEALSAAVTEYVPAAFEALGDSLDESMAPYYIMTDLYMPDSLAAYDDGDGGNQLLDALDAAGEGEWTLIDLGTNLMVARWVDPLANNTVEELCEQHDVLTALKADELDERLYTEGAALEHALDQGAMDTYKAANIKRTV